MKIYLIIVLSIFAATIFTELSNLVKDYPLTAVQLSRKQMAVRMVLYTALLAWGINIFSKLP